MEDWQASHILHNLLELIEFTDCNDSLIVKLQSQNVLSADDVEDIQSQVKKRTKSRHMFEILRTRKESYKLLISALQETCQSGAVEILVAGFILHGTISFQGNLSLISELLPHQNEILTQELITLQKKKPSMDEVVVKNTIPCELGYYVPRTILSCTKLNPSMFQEKCSDVFLFQGFGRNEWTQFINDLPPNVSSDVLENPLQVHTRFRLLESLKEFDIIADQTEEAVHLIQLIDRSYYWKKTRGTVITIQKFVEKTLDLVTEKTFVKKILTDKISVCLTGSPGMGKTVLLANLARAVADRHPHRLVIFVYLRQFIQVLQGKLKRSKLDSQLIQTLLSEYVSDHPVGRYIVSKKLENDHCHLFFDGYDEVLPKQRDVAKSMLKLIANSRLKLQTFVTARPDMRLELEQITGTLGFAISPFQINNQVECLIKFWKSQGVENENLKEYAEKCLSTLTDQTSKDKLEIAGIPLQCYMIGEVFLSKAKTFCQGSDLVANESIISTAHLYNELINMKLDTVVTGVTKESIIQAHIHAAMCLLFPEEVSNFVKYPKGVSHEQLCRVGIMEHASCAGSENGVRFIHQTFAEFVIALFASRLLQNIGKSPRFMFQKVARFLLKFAKSIVAPIPGLKNHILKYDSLSFLLTKVLATYGSHGRLIDNQLGQEYATLCSTRAYKQPIIAYFLNFLLQKNIVDFQSNLHYKFSTFEQYHFVSAAMSHDCFKLFKLYISLIDKCHLQTLSISEGQWYHLQCVAAKYSDVSMLEKIIELTKTSCSDVVDKLSDSERQFQIALGLYVASFVGNFKIVEYLVESKHIKLDDAPFVLHFCMWHTSFQTEPVIIRKVQIIKYLSQCLNTVMNQKYDGALGPILGKYIHLDLIKCALECGAKIQDRDKDSKTILHLTPEYMTPEGYHDLVCLVLQWSDRKIFTEKDAFGCTPLHYAVECLPILSETLEIFLTNSSDINAIDKEGNSVLFYALKFQREKTIELLVNNGAILDDRNSGLETALHIAYKYTNLSAINWLVEQGINQNTRDARGILPSNAMMVFQSRSHQNFLNESRLHFTKKELRFHDTYEARRVNEFNLRNANVFQTRNTPLHLEFLQKVVDFEKVKEQVSLNADFNARNGDGDTPLHLGVCNALISKGVLEFAVKEGRADLNIVNDCGLTVLAQAIYVNRDVSFLKQLVEYGAEVRRLENFKAAIYCSNLENVKFLVEHGANIIKLSREEREGTNPISLAFFLHKDSHFEIVRYLITSTPRVDFGQDCDCNTQIVYHALEAYQKSNKFRSVELFNLLASHGLNFAHCDEIKNPLLFVVARHLDLEHVEDFLKHLVHIGYTNLGDLKGNKSQNLVQYFIGNREADFPIQILPLLGNVKDILNSRNDKGHSVLGYAIQFERSLDYMEELIENGADVDHLDNDKNSLLHHAARFGDWKCIKYFIEKVNDKNSVNIYGNSSLHRAFDKEAENNDNAKLLICNGLSVNLENFYEESIIDSALSAYERWGKSKSAEIFTLMLSHGFDIDSKNHHGSPILFKMMDVLRPEHCEEVLKYLYDNNKITCIHIRGKYGEPLLHRCMKNFEPSDELLRIFKLVGAY